MVPSFELLRTALAEAKVQAGRYKGIRLVGEANRAKAFIGFVAEVATACVVVYVLDPQEPFSVLHAFLLDYDLGLDFCLV